MDDDLSFGNPRVATMPAGLTDLQQYRTVIGRLDAERPAALQDDPGRMPYVDRDDDFQSRLELELTSRRGKARLLVSGQIGVGKSSELHKYEQQHRNQDSYQVFCDLEQETHPDHCGATAVLLAVFRDCWNAAMNLGGVLRSQRGRIRDDTIDKLVDLLKGKYTEDRRQVLFQFHGMDYSVWVHDEQARDTGLRLILGKAALHQAVSEPADQFGLLPEPLLNQLNRLLEWIQRQSNRVPVIFVDHVDKIRDRAAAREVLVDATPQWQRVQASLVMTAPYEYTFGDFRHSIESRWNSPLLVYPLPIPERDTGPIDSAPFVL